MENPGAQFPYTWKSCFTTFQGKSVLFFLFANKLLRAGGTAAQAIGGAPIIRRYEGILGAWRFSA
jgi:hypothetical protein